MSNQTTYAPAITAIAPHEQSIEVIRAALVEMQTYIRAREPEQDGDPLDKVITWRDAVASGLAQYSLGTPGSSGPGGGVFVPPPVGGLAGWDDLTPPDSLDNLTVTSIPTGFFVEFDAPTYRQGGVNAYSIIYQANWDGVSPLPTFADAVPVGTVTERNVILVIAAEPGVQGHFWAQPVSHAEDYNEVAPQTAPTGGLNGVSAVAGQLSNDHIADLSAGKLTAGQIAVGEYIESTGYDPGVFGWHIDGDGDAEFNNVVVRGTIYATAGLIGGAIIDASGVQSDDYDGAGNGWRLDNATGTGLFGKLIVSNVGSTRILDTTATSTDPVLKIDDAIEILADGTASFGGTLTAANIVGTDQIVDDAISGVVTQTGTTTIVSTSVSIPAGQTWKLLAVCYQQSFPVTGPTNTLTLDIGSDSVSVDLINNGALVQTAATVHAYTAAGPTSVSVDLTGESGVGKNITIFCSKK